MVTVEAFQSNFATALYLIDTYLQTHGRYSRYILLFLTTGAITHVILGELIRILYTCSSSTAYIMLEGQTSHEHLFYGEWFFVDGCSNALFHLYDLKIICSAYLAEYFKYLVRCYT